VVSYNATTFRDRDRRLQGVFAAARDMTELKRYEETLQQKNVQLEQASRMKSEFLANMSHELRTPLNAIMGFSEVLRDGLTGPMTQQQRRFASDIFASGQYLLSLINDILDLSKVEAGKMTLDVEPLELSSLFANSLLIIRDKAENRGIAVSLSASSDLGMLQADARKVKQMVYNLLSNAVKFTVDGGQVTLSAARVGRGDVSKLSGSCPGRSFPLADNGFTEFLEISVMDNGIGIDPEGLEQLFKPFRQIDSGLARKYDGSGLGLVLVKLLAELHGGSVAVESAKGQGSCFKVWLPLRNPPALIAPVVLPVASPHPSEQVVLGPRLALIVEDDPKSAALISLLLEAEGYEVVLAGSAEAALTIAMRQKPSLITLDINLPGVDGWTFLTRLKAVESLSNVPVVVISIAADQQKGFPLGAAAFVQKPISRQQLHETLANLRLDAPIRAVPPKVLVVDDDAAALELIAARLLNAGSSVLRAYGGREALAVARQQLPDLIVLELLLPEISGFEVVDALEERPETARIPILIVTAKLITIEDRIRLNGRVTTIMDKGEFQLDSNRFAREVHRAMSARDLAD
jgi:signal transduction histidine kinase/DNA-binding response OmpR family regulator